MYSVRRLEEFEPDEIEVLKSIELSESGETEEEFHEHADMTMWSDFLVWYYYDDYLGKWLDTEWDSRNEMHEEDNYEAQQEEEREFHIGEDMIDQMIQRKCKQLKYEFIDVKPPRPYHEVNR